MAKAKLTWQEKEAKAEAARQERIAKNVADFKARIEKDRALKVYSDKAAFAADSNGETGAWSLYDMVSDYRRTRASLTSEIERAQRRLSEALVFVSDNRQQYSSSVLSSSSADIDMAATEMKVLGRAIVRLSYVLGYYVPDVHTALDNEQRAKLLSLRIVNQPVTIEAVTADMWVIYAGDSQLRGPDVGLVDLPLSYTTEVLAWLAAAQWAGSPISTY
jgi:hypothetical protein